MFMSRSLSLETPPIAMPLHIRLPPRPQGAMSLTFTPLPLADVDPALLLLPDVLSHHARLSPAHPAFVYRDDASGDKKNITWAEAYRAFHRMGRLFSTRLTGLSFMGTVIGILATTDQVTYLTGLAGLLLAGFVPFPISPRNSDAAIAHLLESTACHHLLVNSSDSSIVKLANSVRERMGTALDILEFPSYDELFGSNELPCELSSFPQPKVVEDDLAVIMHSSGSTSFPKIIHITHRFLREAGLTPYYGEVDLCGQVLSVHTIPMCHMLGLNEFLYAIYTGMALAAFSPASPMPKAPTSDAILNAVRATGSTMFVCTPTFLETLHLDTPTVSLLSQLTAVIFGGGPLRPTVGDDLVANGVHLVHQYGSTEASGVSMIIPTANPTEGWDWFQLSPHADPVFKPIEDAGVSGVHQLFLKKCSSHTPAMLDTVLDDADALDTKDLFLQHPTNSSLWKVFGRRDDQIVHSNGEKTNPVPIEKILNEHAAIKHAIIFGHGRFHAGVIVFPEDEERVDPSDLSQVAAFRQLIWDGVEEANRIAPTHSRIFKEMILVANSAKPLQLTAKGIPSRQWVLHSYDQDIARLYEDVEDSFQKHLESPVRFDTTSSLEFVRKVVGEVMAELPPDDADLFQHGCDSLQATWIRNSILHAAASGDKLDYKSLPTNFVYSHPTILALVELLTTLSSTPSSQVECEAAQEQPIVEICGGSDTPLIILPGATGSIARFYGLRQHYKGRIWGVRITDSTPLDSMEVLVQYWADEIRKKQPMGPYRIATFCTASLHGVMLTKLLEGTGEVVSKLCFLDHLPMLYLREGAECVLRAVTQAEYVALAAGEVTALLTNDPTIPAVAVANYEAAARGNPDVPATNLRDARISRVFVGHIYDFLCSFYPADQPCSLESLASPFIRWLSTFNAPAALLVAENGIKRVSRGGAWPDLGASLLGKHVEVQLLDGVGHFGIFSDERVARFLQN